MKSKMNANGNHRALGESRLVHDKRQAARAGIILSPVDETSAEETLVEDTVVGFGVSDAQFQVLLSAPPPMAAFAHLTTLIPLKTGDIAHIGKECGNGWRKIFNVYAKLLFALPTGCFNFSTQAHSWQQFRDEMLLQTKSNTALLFSPPRLCQSQTSIQLIAGRTLAKSYQNQGLALQLHWLTPEFAVDLQHKVLVTPFFDYRQLNNQKIAITAKLVKLLVDDMTAIEPYAIAATQPQVFTANS